MSSDQTVPNDPAERERLLHRAGTDAQTACGVEIRHLVNAEAVAKENQQVNCPFCLDVLDRATGPLPAAAPWVETSAVFTPPAATDVGLSDDELERQLRESAARIDPPPAVDSWVPVAWCQNGWHNSSGLPEGPCPTCGQTDRMDATTSDWLSPDLTRCANCGEPEAILSARSWCVGCEEQDAATPERRTVGLEVLTDEHRAVANKAITEEAARYKRSPVLLPDLARVAVAVRINGTLVAAPDVDLDFAAPYRQDADVLAALLRQARASADHYDAELLMPGPDVLAALQGKPVGRWTAPVETRWGLVKPGWLALVDKDATGSGEMVWRTVLDRVDCTQPDCRVANDHPWACAVTTIAGRPVEHLDAFVSVGVRIPADEAVEL